MTYLKMNGIDFSAYVNDLKVTNTHKYSALTNAAGNTIVDYINNKRTLEVGIIPVDDAAMAQLMEVINSFSVVVSFRNPQTNVLEEDVNFIIPMNSVAYYTIRADKVMYDGFVLNLQEL